MAKIMLIITTTTTKTKVITTTATLTSQNLEKLQVSGQQNSLNSSGKYENKTAEEKEGKKTNGYASTCFYLQYTTYNNNFWKLYTVLVISI